MILANARLLSSHYLAETCGDPAHSRPLDADSFLVTGHTISIVEFRVPMACHTYAFSAFCPVLPVGVISNLGILQVADGFKSHPGHQPYLSDDLFDHAPVYFRQPLLASQVHVT